MRDKELSEFYEEFIKYFPPELYLNEVGEPYGVFPFYKDQYHENYGGKDAIIVGNDTEITNAGSGLFKIVDYRAEQDLEILNNEDVIEFYFGIGVAYSIAPFDEKPLAFRKGFKKGLHSVANLVDTKNQTVKKFNPNNN